MNESQLSGLWRTAVQMLYHVMPIMNYAKERKLQDNTKPQVILFISLLRSQIDFAKQKGSYMC